METEPGPLSRLSIALKKSDGVKARLDAVTTTRSVEHPFGTMKARMGATHFLAKSPRKVPADMPLSVRAII